MSVQATGEPLAPAAVFDPLTGLPAEVPTEKQPPRFDPVTGELIPALPAPAVTPPSTVGTTRMTEQSIIALARADAGTATQAMPGELAAALPGSGKMPNI